MIYEFLANGFEDIEALAPVDILRRGGLDVRTVSITGSEFVESAHGVTVRADVTFEEAGDFSDADMLLLPGGMPGAMHLKLHDGVRAAVLAQAQRGGRVGAICAAPMVLGSLGLLQGRKATCYPGFEPLLTGATYTGDLVTVDGNVVTGKGPGASFAYAFTLCELLYGKTTADALREGMIYTF